MVSTSQSPDHGREPLRSGAELRSAHFVTTLNQRGATDPRVSFEISLRREGSERISLHSASSYWLEELHDMLDVVSRQMRRNNGASDEYQALGRCMGVRVAVEYNEDTDEESDGTRVFLMTEDDENWHPSENTFDPSLLPELHTLVGEVLDALRVRAEADSSGFGFRFKRS